MGFKAGKQILITRDGQPCHVMPGDPVPEAAEWPQDVLLRCMRVGQIVNVPDEAFQDVTRPLEAQDAANKFVHEQERAKLLRKGENEALESVAAAQAQKPKAKTKKKSKAKAKKQLASEETRTGA